MKKDEVLIVIACKEESNNLIEKLGAEIIYTGIGKINATYHLTKVLTQKKLENKLPKYVINVGSCGSRKFKKGQLVACNKFIQRDIDCGTLGITPREEELYIIEHKKFIND